MSDEQIKLEIKAIINHPTKWLPTNKHFDLVLEALLDKHIDIYLEKEAKKEVEK